MEFDYERDLHIDESALDVEWLNQPMLLMKYSRELASAEREVSRIKEKQAVLKAELDKDIRLHPEKFGIDSKLTEAVVTGAILLNDKHKKVAEELIEAQYEARMLKGAVEACQQRKDALQDLVKLHGQRYFAGPNMPRDLSHEVKLQQEKQVSNSTVKIKRRA
jgi:hypothetical protein